MRFFYVAGIFIAHSVVAADLPMDGLEPLDLASTGLASTGLESKVPLSNTELAQLRGKYTKSGQDFYFGLQMQTRYLDIQGMPQQVQMQIEMANSGMHITIGESADNYDGAIALSTAGQQSGLQQRIQIAGDFNQTNNRFDFEQGKLESLQNGVEVTITNNLVSSNSGDVVYSVSGGVLGYQVEMGSAQATQGLSSGQLLQSINVNGAYHQISNSTLIRYQGIDLGASESQILGQQVRDIMGLGL